MKDYEFDLSRRKVLGAIGAIGAASAGAGLGTSALFSDQETFEDNRLVAGELDLKMDWEEHYSFPQYYGFDDPTAGLDVTRSEPTDTTDYAALPDPSNPLVWVHNDDLNAYMDNTAIEAYPDVDDDGIQDPFRMDGVGDFCTDGADLNGGLDPFGDGAFRTNNVDTYTPETETIEPLVNLSDVKPGDFGELTLSLHLCDNPGYIWMNGGLVEARESGITEAESDSSDAGPADEVVTDLTESDGVELLDEIQTVAWYDGDCDNVLDGSREATGGEFADVVIVMDVSGSMDGELADAQAGANELVAALGPNDQVGLVSFSSSSPSTSSSSLDVGLTSNHNDVSTAINGLSAGGGTNIEAAIERAHDELTVADIFTEYTESGSARPGARQIMVFLGDGSENAGTDVTDSGNEDPVQEASNAKADGIEIFTIAYGTSAPSLSDLASDPNNPPESPESQYAFGATTEDVETVFRNIGGTVSSGGEEVFHQGSLRDLLLRLEDGDGIPLDGDIETEGRSCFAGLQTHCVGLAWWIPTEVENQIQSDSVSFDVGFYAEQCRNNEQTPEAEV
ncbi:vWA domain-containing protein [Haloplanus salilacus]|uniref:vWA domain-containing protein n=1 Tax=Haloplanus salilacus TaxID=2949994 RepID=UPI0030D22942